MAIRPTRCRRLLDLRATLLAITAPLVVDSVLVYHVLRARWLLAVQNIASTWLPWLRGRRDLVARALLLRLVLTCCLRHFRQDRRRLGARLLHVEVMWLPRRSACGRGEYRV